MPPSRDLPFWQVDAFSGDVFSGNPAAVVLLEANHTISDTVMQACGAENNLSETAFVSVSLRRWGSPSRPPLQDREPCCLTFSIAATTPDAPSLPRSCLARQQTQQLQASGECLSVSRIRLVSAGSPPPLRFPSAGTPPWPPPTCCLKVRAAVRGWCDPFTRLGLGPWSCSKQPLTGIDCHPCHFHNRIRGHHPPQPTTLTHQSSATPTRPSTLKPYPAASPPPPSRPRCAPPPYQPHPTGTGCSPR